MFNLINHIRDIDDKSIVIWLFNVGVEKYWNGFDFAISGMNSKILSNHMEGLVFLVARERDYIILREEPNPLFLLCLRKYGFQLANILVINKNDEMKGMGELIVNDYELIDRIKDIKKISFNTYFVPFGVSEYEEAFAKVCNIKLVGGISEIVKKINNKVYARELAEKIGANITDGIVANNVGQIRDWAKQVLIKGEKVIIKNVMCASGKGLYLVEDDSKLEHVIQILERYKKKWGINIWVVERWYQKKIDLNYQIYIDGRGDVLMFSLTKQILRKTIYIGTGSKVSIEKSMVERLKNYAVKIGRSLYEIGYTGIAGIDAFVDEDNRLIPVVEINARLTLSTFLAFLCPQYGDYFLSFYVDVPKINDKNYEDLLNYLKVNGMEYSTRLRRGIIPLSKTMNLINTGELERIFIIILYSCEREKWNYIEILLSWLGSTDN